MKPKTRKSVLKRFKVTKTGKVLHRSQGARHLKANKTQRRLRSLRQLKKVTRRQRIKVLQMLNLK